MMNDFCRKILWRQIVIISLVAVGLALLGQVWLSLRLKDMAIQGSTLNAAIGELLVDYRQAAYLQQRYGQVLKRQQLIESLDGRRSTSVLLLADVAEALPDQVYLTRLEEDGARFLVEGRAVDNADIAKFIENLSASAYLADVVLNEIRALDQDMPAAYQFSLGARVQLVSPDLITTVAEQATP